MMGSSVEYNRLNGLSQFVSWTPSVEWCRLHTIGSAMYRLDTTGSTMYRSVDISVVLHRLNTTVLVAWRQLIYRLWCIGWMPCPLNGLGSIVYRLNTILVGCHIGSMMCTLDYVLVARSVGN
jgi:hypothetical protein